MKIRMKFSKQGPLKFIGHLDIMRYFQKVMRRADVDIRYSELLFSHRRTAERRGNLCAFLSLKEK